jgi:hypothetical protein
MTQAEQRHENPAKQRNVRERERERERGREKQRQTDE